ncbi:MAG: nucleotide exchange factor GrpE, partial [Lachnospiraceae bacterium]|nr:nucleotide exchange factor GrpE [Lachnospiraceae bacterium]
MENYEDKELNEQEVNENSSEEAATPEEEQTQETAAEETVTDEAAENEAEGKEKKKKSLLGKSKDKKADKLQEKVTELEDRVKRQMAEFDNFRKRTEKEKSAMFETGAKSVVEKIL